MRINEGQTVVPAYKPPTTQKPPAAKPQKPKPQSNVLSDADLIRAASAPMNGNVSYAYTPANSLAQAALPSNVSYVTPWQPSSTLTNPAPGYGRPQSNGNKQINGRYTPPTLNPTQAPPFMQASGAGLTTVTGQQSVTNNPDAEGNYGRFVPGYIGNGGPGPGDPGYAASTINYGSPLNNPGFGISLAGGGLPATGSPAALTGNPNDPNNPLNGLDPKYNTSGRGGTVDFNDADWNPALPYRTGGYDLAEVMNNNADMYRTGFNYANNFEGAYLGQIEGYDTAGNPLPQIAGYYVHNGKYYPIDLRSYAHQNNTPTWQQYTGYRGNGGGNSGGGGSGGGGGGTSSPINGNDEFFQQSLNWKI